MATIKDLPIAQLLSAPGAPSVTPQGTPGATTHTYRVVAVSPEGLRTQAGATGTTGTGAATLNGTNFNRLTWSAVPGADRYEIYRTVGGATQGKIATTALTTLDDTGLIGDAATPPSTNETGRGEPVYVSTLRDLTIHMRGTYVAEMDLEGSLFDNGQDGDEYWATITALNSGPGGTIFCPPMMWNRVRVRMTAWTSGTPIARIGGHVEV